MNNETKRLLNDLITGIYNSRHYLCPDEISHCTDVDRLVRLTNNILDTEDSLDQEEIQLVITEIYESETNNNEFVQSIYSQIEGAKLLLHSFKSQYM